MVKTKNTKSEQQDEKTKLANRIKQARESAHLSQKELGDFIGVSDKSISSYEKARSTPPIEKLKKISGKTNKPLLFFTEEKTTKIDILSKLIVIEKELHDVLELATKLQKENKL